MNSAAGQFSRCTNSPFRAFLGAGILFLLSVATTARAQEPLRTSADRPIDIEHIRLDISVDLDTRVVKGRATIDFKPLRPTSVVSLDAVNLTISHLEASPRDGKRKAVAHDNTGEQLHIDFGRTLNRDESWRLAIDYQVKDPASGLHFHAPTKEAPHVEKMVWSQGEPISNRYWFPCLDNPNERQSTEMVVTVKKGLEVLSNGKLLSRKVSTDGKSERFHWKQEKSHVAYLVTLVVGDFVVKQEEWRGRPVTYYVPKSRAADIDRTFGRTVKMLDFFSDRFGIEYPWEKYAQVVVEQFLWGGMENTSATTLYQRAMHDKRAMIDSTPDWLIAHELGHQWWGDLVTCKDWSHLWLNEGFATYSEVLWAEHYDGNDERDYVLFKDARSARSSTTLTRPVVDRRYPHPQTMFDNRVYPKGGWILHMLRSQLGDDDFFRGLQRYGTVYAYQTAETGDLRQVFERLYGVSLERFFFDWTQRPGHPDLLVKSTWQPKDKLLRLDVSQTQKADPFHIPVRIETGVQGKPEPVVFERMMTDRSFTAYLPLPARPTSVRVDPEYTLLANIKEQKSPDFWKEQLLHGRTVPERIRAVEHVVTAGLGAQQDAIHRCLTQDPFYGVRVEAARALGRKKGNNARQWLIAGLAQDEARVRRACADGLAGFKNDDVVLAALQKKHAAGDASYFVESSVLAALTSVSPRPPVTLLTAALAKPSHRETIRLAALKGLAQSDDPAVLAVLLDWTKPDKSHLCRADACARLADYANRNALDEKQTEPIVKRLIEILEKDDARMRRASATALGRLGSRAAEAATLLESVMEGDPNGRARDAAKAAIPRLQSTEPASAELARLRREIESARKRNQQLEQRLRRLEAK